MAIGSQGLLCQGDAEPGHERGILPAELLTVVASPQVCVHLPRLRRGEPPIDIVTKEGEHLTTPEAGDFTVELRHRSGPPP